MNILLFYYDFNLDVELLVCALLTTLRCLIKINKPGGGGVVINGGEGGGGGSNIRILGKTGHYMSN